MSRRCRIKSNLIISTKKYIMNGYMCNVLITMILIYIIMVD